MLAFAFRPNRIKYHDLWDISWLHGQGLKPRLELIPAKIQDRNTNMEYFLRQLDDRKEILKENKKMELEFKQEMRRFLSTNQINKTLEQDNLWALI